MVRNGLQKAKKKGIPVITFDSDFDSSTLDKYENLRLAYIGSDNLAFGKALGEQVKKLRPNGGKLCIQSAHKGESNLILRMMGVRSALSGKTYTSPPGKKLKNVNGWTEISRCPLYGNGQSVPSIEQMKFILRKAPKEVDTFVAVGGWVQMNNIKKYREMIPLFKEKMDRREIAVVIGDTTEGQLECLKDHLSHINVGQRPYDMGRQAIFTLYNIVKKNGYKKVIYTPLTYCTPENYDTCTKSSN
jgi:ribose transport system substrate-binding protein